MALTKPPVKNVWADTAGDNVEPSGAEVQAGWPLSAIPPARQRFNWILNFLSNGIRYLTRRGIPDHDVLENYEIGDKCRSTDGFTYSAKLANINKLPQSNPTEWELWGFTKTQLDAFILGTDYKQSVRIASTANIASLSGLAAIDGVTPVANDRILLKDQSTASQNGIYVAAAGAWTRALDADTGAELNGGAIIPVEEGTVNADTNWQLSNNGAVTIGTTGLTFQSVGSQNFASNAEAQALSILTKSISPGTLNAAFQGSNQSLISAGYQKLPGGLIIQWGSGTFSIAGTAVTFPISFPTSVKLVVASGGNNNLVSINAYTASLSGFTAQANTGAGGPYAGQWVAIGN